jgi:hypothetical protein
MTFSDYGGPNEIRPTPSTDERMSDDVALVLAARKYRLMREDEPDGNQYLIKAHEAYRRADDAFDRILAALTTKEEENALLWAEHEAVGTEWSMGMRVQDAHAAVEAWKAGR